MGSPSRLDPIPILSRCQSVSRTQEFGFEFGFGTLSKWQGDEKTLVFQ